MRYQDCAEAAQADDGAFATPAADTSINAATGLSTDYLNHFNEAIMLLDMLRDAPDCRDDFLTWRAKSYREHFAASRVRSRDTAIAAYAAADAHARESLDALAGIMTMMLEATKDAMSGLAPDTAGMLGARAAAYLKPLVVRAGAVINGETGDKPAAPQAMVDGLLNR